jgi:predicted protein tyrosine phosphatase
MDVKIMSRKSLMELAKKPFSSDVAVISITNSDYEDVALQNQPYHILRLKFDDVSDDIFEELLGRKPNVREMHQIASKFRMLGNAQTRQMADFILGLKNKGTLICQCEYGESRSAGVAAAVMEYYYRKGVNVFADARYYPNKHVYRKLLGSLRIRGGRRCSKSKMSRNVQ